MGCLEMSEPTVLFVKPKTISAADRVRLSKIGVTVIETDDPSSCKLVRPVPELAGGEILRAAARTLLHASSDYVRSTFAKNICDAILKDDHGTASG